MQTSTPPYIENIEGLMMGLDPLSLPLIAIWFVAMVGIVGHTLRQFRKPNPQR